MNDQLDNVHVDDIAPDLHAVGSDKPLGYVPLGQLTERGHTIEALVAQFENRGLRTVVLGPDATCIASGALFVYHPDALEQELNNGNAVLYQAGWPTIGLEQFIRAVALVTAPADSDLFRLIARAYGDKKSVGVTNDAEAD